MRFALSESAKFKAVNQFVYLFDFLILSIKRQKNLNLFEEKLDFGKKKPNFCKKVKGTDYVLDSRISIKA